MASRTTHTQSFARQEQTQNLCETDHDKAVANYASFSIILTEMYSKVLMQATQDAQWI
jgi:hypothetical protein